MSFRARGIRDEDFGMPPANPDAGMTPGVVIRTNHTEVPAMAKAKQDGVYIKQVDGEELRFFVAEGDEIPEDTTFEAAKDAQATQERQAAEEPETRNKGAAPENRAK